MNNIFDDYFTMTPEYLRQQVEQAHREAVNEAMRTIQEECLKAAEKQHWGVYINMYRFDIDPDDIEHILELLETLGFTIDKPDEMSLSITNPSYDVYITWDDEYDKNELYG